ncbi:MAG: DUF2304 domain-containing protein [Bryobacterales bacterium]|nr:DUF2304 domain-containing protein [Bryobacterales bacterium]
MNATAGFLVAVSLVLILAVLVEVRRAHIRVEYSVSWLFAGVALLLVSSVPGMLTLLSRGMSLEEEPLTLILVVGCIFLFVLFRLSIVVSSLKDNNIALAQRVAILEFQIAARHEEKPSE